MAPDPATLIARVWWFVPVGVRDAVARECHSVIQLPGCRKRGNSPNDEALCFEVPASGALCTGPRHRQSPGPCRAGAVCLGNAGTGRRQPYGHPGVAGQVAERLRQAVARTPVYTGDHMAPVSITISVGVATLIPDRQQDASELIRRADEALYDAKAGGRNQLVAWRPPTLASREAPSDR
ncbi:MAG: hypothetical protein B7X58_06815 [Marinobacter sp. 34-60-7]|nr:MAG: hypothetical protein B7X58_06815 [Marinobacter sp. 34-60-7]